MSTVKGLRSIAIQLLNLTEEQEKEIEVMEKVRGLVEQFIDLEFTNPVPIHGIDGIADIEEFQHVLEQALEAKREQ